MVCVNNYGKVISEKKIYEKRTKNIIFGTVSSGQRKSIELVVPYKLGNINYSIVTI